MTRHPEGNGMPAHALVDTIRQALESGTGDEPVRASLGALPLSSLRRVEHVDELREVPGNWKLHAWNFMDTFHIPYIHQFCLNALAAAHLIDNEARDELAVAAFAGRAEYHRDEKPAVQVHRLNSTALRPHACVEPLKQLA